MSAERSTFASNAISANGGSGFGREQEPRASEVHMAGGGDPYGQWLDTVHSLPLFTPHRPPSRELMDRSHRELSLGYIEMGDSLFQGIGAAVQVDAAYRFYDLAVTFFPAPPSRPRLDRTVPVVPTLDMKSFIHSLQTDESVGKKYSFIPDNEENPTMLTIARTQDEMENTSTPAFTFQTEPTQQGLGYRLNLREKGLTPESLERFPDHLTSLRELTRALTAALYPGHGLEVSKRELDITAPEDIDKFVAEVESDFGQCLQRVSDRGNNDGLYYV